MHSWLQRGWEGSISAAKSATKALDFLSQMLAIDIDGAA